MAATVERMLEMLDAIWGSVKPEAAARNPAMSAYSIRSCPWLSFQIFNFRLAFMIFFICFASWHVMILPAASCLVKGPNVPILLSRRT